VNDAVDHAQRRRDVGNRQAMRVHFAQRAAEYFKILDKLGREAIKLTARATVAVAAPLFLVPAGFGFSEIVINRQTGARQLDIHAPRLAGRTRQNRFSRSTQRGNCAISRGLQSLRGRRCPRGETHSRGEIG